MSDAIGSNIFIQEILNKIINCNKEDQYFTFAINYKDVFLKSSLVFQTGFAFVFRRLSNKQINKNYMQSNDIQENSEKKL